VCFGLLRDAKRWLSASAPLKVSGCKHPRVAALSAPELPQPRVWSTACAMHTQHPCAHVSLATMRSMRCGRPAVPRTRVLATCLLRCATLRTKTCLLCFEGVLGTLARACAADELHPLQKGTAPSMACWWHAALPEHAASSAAGAGRDGALGLASAADRRCAPASTSLPHWPVSAGR